MDDYLTIFDADLNNSKKYERFVRFAINFHPKIPFTPLFLSVQSRFFHLHVPPEEVKWTVCDFCGCPVNKLLFENHVIIDNLHLCLFCHFQILRHELVGITYTLYHFELREEKQRQELIQRIQVSVDVNMCSRTIYLKIQGISEVETKKIELRKILKIKS